MENAKKRRSYLWLVVIISVVAVAAVVVGILYFVGQKPADPADREKTAERFIEAYITQDRLTQFDLTLYDARARWEATLIKEHGSEAAFCAVAQKQADEKGIDVTINSFDDYLRGNHQQDLVYKKDAYGDYTMTVKTVASKKMDADQASTFIAGVAGAVGDDYFPADAANAIKEVYAMTVNIAIDGTINHYNENYPVYMAYYDGQWLVLSHST